MKVSRGNFAVLVSLAVLYAPMESFVLSHASFPRQNGGGWSSWRLKGGSTLGMASTVPRTIAARTSAKREDEFFHAKGTDVKFGSLQTVQAVMPAASFESVEQYLMNEPARIVYACWDNKRVEPLGDGCFRLSLEERQFLSLKLAISIDIRLWAEGGKVRCQSLGWQSDELVRALGPGFAESFSLEMSGDLSAERRETQLRGLTLTNTVLSGNVGVKVGGNMPPLLAATPLPLVKAACLGINNSVLEYVSNIFIGTIAQDFQTWVAKKELAV